MTHYKRDIPGQSTSPHSRRGYMSMTEIRKQIPVSNNKLKQLLDDGILPSIRNGPARLVPVADVLDYEARMLRESRKGVSNKSAKN